MRRPSQSNALAKAIILKCNSMGMYVWRNNTVGVFDPATKRYRANVTHRGVGDVIGLTAGGKHVEFEIKIGSDKQSQFQIDHETRIVSRNGYYFVVKNIQELENIIKKYAVLLG